jgi:hypothetical protein
MRSALLELQGPVTGRLAARLTMRLALTPLEQELEQREPRIWKAFCSLVKLFHVEHLTLKVLFLQGYSGFLAQVVPRLQEQGSVPG